MTTFVGIVEEPESGTVTVGMANEDDGSVTGWSFEVERAHLNDYYVAQPDGGTSYQLSPDVARLGGFLQQRISDRSRARFLVEVPDTIPHPANDPKGIPHPVVPADSVILKVLVFLGVHGYVAAPFQFNPDRDIAVIFPILPGSDLAHLRSISPKYLPHGICKAYGQLLSLDGERPEHIAIVGALIAKNAGAYHYWSSIGLVQTSYKTCAQVMKARRESSAHRRTTSSKSLSGRCATRSTTCRSNTRSERSGTNTSGLTRTRQP